MFGAYIRTKHPLEIARQRGDRIANRRAVGDQRVGRRNNHAALIDFLGVKRKLADGYLSDRYLAAIAAKQAHTLARGERRRTKRELASKAPDEPSSPEQIAHGARLAGRVRDALAAMPNKRRQAALLRLDAGLSYREIAKALGSTEGSTRVLVHTALKELKERLADLMTGASEESS